MIPAATYRIQFHKDFNFTHLEKIIPYLCALGVDTLYASPIFNAAPGSTHGYDVTDPLKINPEIGTEKQLLKISARLKKAGIRWIQDIVPNHMAFHPSNKWLMDVLTKGRKSKFAEYFDIDFENWDGRLMVPFLGEELDQAVRGGAVRLKKSKGEYLISAAGENWPVNSQSIGKLKGQKLKDINSSTDRLLALLDEQFYRLCHWRETDSRINYRRFFTVNSLICLNIQYKKVFTHYHSYLLDLLSKGIFDGLRIDHVDGLYDVEAYLTQLRKAVGKETYIVVEKILESGEALPENWPIQGTTGYDFLSQVNNLLTNRKAEQDFEKIYQRFTGKKQDVPETMLEKKAAMLSGHMQGELENLSKLFSRLSLEVPNGFDGQLIKDSIEDFLVHMPVYRFYAYTFPLTGKALDDVEGVITAVRSKKSKAQRALFLKQLFLEIPLKADRTYLKNLSQFYQRLMQFSGPLMAKGIEDTMMFTFNRFTAHNEVGDAPDAFGSTTRDFHEQMIARQHYWPHAMNASATHDTKRGEDFRARLNVLSDLPERWSSLMEQITAELEVMVKKAPRFKALHLNDIYLLLQTIFGAMPFAGPGAEDFGLRLEEFIRKALREAKKRSDWAAPDEAYEALLISFSAAILKERHPLGKSLWQLFADLKDFAVINSLVQLLLKFSCPGVPDCYQGTELWELSLVDPDNRRAVDYARRKEMLMLIDSAQPLQKLWKERDSGLVKLALSKCLLALRNDQRALFAEGAYIPLKVSGKYAAHVIAFARRLKEQWLLIAAPLGMAKLIGGNAEAMENFDWEDTQILLPAEAPLAYLDLLNKKDGHKDILNKGIMLKELFSELPFALVELQKQKTERSAGILLHISSLPADYGIGDLGPSARAFVNFLQQARQRYWQLLPLNPTKSANGHSPYSSSSAMAGNTLLISLDDLAEDGFIDQSDLIKAKLPASEMVDFEACEEMKCHFLHRAFKSFVSKPEYLEAAFEAFCDKQAFWLDDYALYAAIKKHHNGREWYQWPEEYKFRKAKALLGFEKRNKTEISEIKWLQFIFFRQYNRLKAYANDKRVQLIGDLPFYIDEDSVEVWSNPDNFLLDDKHDKLFVAGVPPDYFNASGQLWGMPIFNWANIKAEGFKWWMSRLKQNLMQYDLLRLDHFRAFAAYWQITAGAEDASEGEWVEGPGSPFFDLVNQHFPTMPFIAEDLGERADAVERLMAQFGLPGMRVLQFGFSEQLSSSPHAIHNFEDANCIVYSGTHDNNTLKGWFRQETTEEIRKRLDLYFGLRVTESNINELMVRLAYCSVAKLAIIPMQDLLSLDENSRMNIPGSAQGNWRWRMSGLALADELADQLASLTEIFRRV
ncbi:malto-oligosyltrehalose synthase [Pedobacter aquatilis]|uniref:malto-oligosyltrehalose synthase n=1 Tax=Pedobacter aquatilis TaxID=351343 RepID=UPI00292F983E|nr:malto-oligosyltrehalose synthase [Pedobacter aquatilis]